MKKLLAAVAALAAFGAASAASAADINIVVPAPPVVPVPVEPAGFDWSGFYAGVVGGAWLPFDSSGERYGRIAGVLGANFEVGDRFVLGAETQIGVYDFSDVTFEVMGLGRAGVLLGDRVLAFGAVGVQWEEGGPALVTGGGFEFAIGDSLSFRAEVLAYKAFGTPFSYVTLDGGLVFHFGN